ncbi:MAG: hypothetical protein ACKPKO_57420, partial [Candidatus Fonsibacter sp.]
PRARPMIMAYTTRVGSKCTTGRDCIHPSQPMGKLGSQTVKYQLKAFSLQKKNPNNNTPS